MTCPTAPCQIEQTSQSSHSPGPVLDAELVCRWALDPSHINARTRHIKASIIEKGPLSRGMQSAYRAGKETNFHFDDLRDLYFQSPRPGQTLVQILGVRASKIRDLSGQGGPALRVVDETECDREGNHHPNHVHITPCRWDPAYPLNDNKADWLLPLQDKLVLLFKSADQTLNVSAG